VTAASFKSWNLRHKVPSDRWKPASASLPAVLKVLRPRKEAKRTDESKKLRNSLKVVRWGWIQNVGFPKFRFVNTQNMVSGSLLDYFPRTCHIHFRCVDVCVFLCHIDRPLLSVTIKDDSTGLGNKCSSIPKRLNLMHLHPLDNKNANAMLTDFALKPKLELPGSGIMM
jgi:hypothetical protein